MEQEKSAHGPSRNAAKRFLLVLLGSLFVQCFCWAMYSLLELQTWMCGLSIIVTALLYHFVQLEEQTGVSRKSVFFAGILTPFLLALCVTAAGLLRHPDLTLLGADADGVSPLTELLSLYSARLVINGPVLMLFALLDAKLLRNLHPEEKRHEEA